MYIKEMLRFTYKYIHIYIYIFVCVCVCVCVCVHEIYEKRCILKYSYISIFTDLLYKYIYLYT